MNKTEILEKLHQLCLDEYVEDEIIVFNSYELEDFIFKLIENNND